MITVEAEATLFVACTCTDKHKYTQVSCGNVLGCVCLQLLHLSLLWNSILLHMRSWFLSTLELALSGNISALLNTPKRH